MGSSHPPMPQPWWFIEKIPKSVRRICWEACSHPDAAKRLSAPAPTLCWSKD
ncbi:MAG: hypothetical protein ACRDQ4_01640 [Pseudonocardiaceae bacterium]